MRIEIKKEKENYRASVFHNSVPKKRERAQYWNIIDKDKQKFSQFLMDLYFEGFPIMEAYKIFLGRIKKKDWLGV